MKSVTIKDAPSVLNLNDKAMWVLGFNDALGRYAQLEQAEMVIAPHYRGYARLGVGTYCINHSADDAEPELVISVATDEEKAGRAVGEDRGNAEGALIQPNDIAVRIAFENVAGLDALEKQLRRLRESHFAVPVQPKADPLTDDLVGALAEVRDLFPVPEHGSPIEREWASAMADPCSVPDYVRVCIRQPKAEPLTAIEWVCVAAQMPKSGQTVLACYINSHGHVRRVRAEWIKAKTVESSPMSDCGEYDEEADVYYDPEGWYEKIDNWDEYAAVFMSPTVTHWMPLPDAPNGIKGGAV